MEPARFKPKIKSYSDREEYVCVNCMSSSEPIVKLMSLVMMNPYFKLIICSHDSLKD